jgi:hypothetical protein
MRIDDEVIINVMAQIVETEPSRPASASGRRTQLTRLLPSLRYRMAAN